MKKSNEKSRVKIGDVLTSVTIIISLIALLISWSQDRNLRKKEQADIYRNAAAITIAKIERWKNLSLSIFQKAQPLYVEISNKIVGGYNWKQADIIKNSDIILARDYLWQSLNEIKMLIYQKTMDEEIETAYVHLYSYHPTIREVFTSTIDRFKNKEELMFNKLLKETEKNVLSFQNYDKKKYSTAMLGNKLRSTSIEIQESYKKELNEVCSLLEKFLSDMILKPDNILLKKRIMPEELIMSTNDSKPIENVTPENIKLPDEINSHFDERILPRYDIEPRSMEPPETTMQE